MPTTCGHTIAVYEMRYSHTHTARLRCGLRYDMVLKWERERCEKGISRQTNYFRVSVVVSYFTATPLGLISFRVWLIDSFCAAVAVAPAKAIKTYSEFFICMQLNGIMWTRWGSGSFPSMPSFKSFYTIRQLTEKNFSCVLQKLNFFQLSHSLISSPNWHVKYTVRVLSALCRNSSSSKIILKKRSFFSITHFNSHLTYLALHSLHWLPFDKNDSCHFKSIPRWCNFFLLYEFFNCVWFLPNRYIYRSKYSELNVARANEAKNVSQRHDWKSRMSPEKKYMKLIIIFIYFFKNMPRQAIEWDHSNKKNIYMRERDVVGRKW